MASGPTIHSPVGTTPRSSKPSPLTAPGNLWVGTHEAESARLVPNHEWRTFTVQNTPSLFNNRISTIAVDSGGDIWISSTVA